MTVDLPGGPYRIEGLSEAQLEAVSHRYSRWALDESVAAPVSIELLTAAPEDFFGPDLASPLYAVDMDHRPESMRIAALYFMAIAELRESATAGLWTAVEERDTFIGVIENLLRPLVAQRILADGGLMLHSSGVVVNDRCFLFAGHSGAGKSTIAGLAIEHGHGVLSDDLNCLTRGESGWTARRLPFAGDHQSSADEGVYPVAGLFRLEKGGVHRIDAMSAGDGFSLIYSNAPYVNSDPHRAQRLEEIVLGVTASIPVRRLTFRRDAGVWPIIEGS